MAANTRLDTLSDYIRRDANLRVACACGRVVVIDAVKLHNFYFLHRWTTTIATVGLHLRCAGCGARPVKVSPSPDPPSSTGWEPANEWEWRRLQRRLRG